MASPTQNPYTFQRASTMATRSLVSSDKASGTTTTSDAATEMPSPDSFEKPGIVRRRTHNYEEAAAASAAAAKATEAPVAEDDASSVPAPVAKRQSWNYQDMIRQATEQVLGNTDGGSGYSTAQ